MGFSNIDVVLAFQGNHAKSFVTNFAPKKSNHRCVRAYEVCLIDPQPGIETKEQVEVYVMTIQKSRRGARQGRTDRKKSYKLSDMGLLVGECPLDASYEDIDDYDNPNLFSSVHGQMFGFQRNGHYRLLLDRNKCRRMIVMPVSFGHPAATDKSLSFVVRFNADSPLMIRELPTVPRIDRLLSDFFFQTKPPGHMEMTRQGQRKVLLETSHYRIVQIDCLGNGGGTLFVYLCVSPSATSMVSPISFQIVAQCRGMSCRTVTGLLEHETIAKGQKFEASWRQYKTNFTMESKSRLLMVLFQSGQDTEVGSVTCTRNVVAEPMGNENASSTGQSRHKKDTTLDEYWNRPLRNGDKIVPTSMQDDSVYAEKGIFHPVSVDESTFALCGSNHQASASLAIASLDSMYEQNSGSFVVDTDLQKAIELSQMEMNKNVIAVESVSIDEFAPGMNSFLHHDAESMDLNRAIELSMMDETIDVHGDKRKNMTQSNGLSDNVRKSYVVDMTDELVLDDGDTNKLTIDPLGSKARRKVLTKSTGENQNDTMDKVVLDLTDSDEIPMLSGIAVSNGRQQLDVAIDSASKADGTIGPKNEESNLEIARQSKRTLAAQAALKRLEGR